MFSKWKKANPFQSEFGAGFSSFTPRYVPHFGCWSKMGVAGTGTSMSPISIYTNVVFLYVFNYRSLCLTGSPPNLPTPHFVSFRSQCKCPLSETYHSVSSRSPVNMPYLTLFMRMSELLFLHYSFLPFLSKYFESRDHAIFHTICPHSLILCLACGRYMTIMCTCHAVLELQTLQQNRASAGDHVCWV